ncbi:MAG: hypothetical protein WCJ29_04535 [bacterium]
MNFIANSQLFFIIGTVVCLVVTNGLAEWLMKPLMQIDGDESLADDEGGGAYIFACLMWPVQVMLGLTFIFATLTIFSFLLGASVDWPQTVR